MEEYKIENFYYSYTYDMTNTLCKNMVNNSLALFNITTPKWPNGNSAFTKQP